ncbi:MAG: family 43 glycosylhydrolase [Planctomycetes bacterium]|nr:family 43 glycosylhydrolase [Planctomycetota bacterium]
MYDTIRPGQPWLDTHGNRIQAHGGSIIAVGDTFYWYGENKEKTLPGSGIWHYGVRMYRSKDLYNWEDLGLVLPPVLDDPASPLHPAQCMDRPHILYCAATRTFVLWMKIMGKDGIQFQTVATAGKVTGPYTILRSFRPLGMSCGDFDLVVEPTDGKGYYVFERVHSELIWADLTDDYTGVTGYYSTHFPRTNPPFVREAPAYFRRGRLHYLFTSGTTGYYPNRSEVACAWSYHGPWTVLGDPHPGDREHTSFRSQITSVFRHPGRKDLYIALADRWLTDLPQTLPDIDGAFDAAYGNDPADLSKLKHLKDLSAQNTSVADYVWLPVRFDGDMAYLDWRDEWRIEEFPEI